MSYIPPHELKQAAETLVKEIDFDNLKPKDRLKIPMQEMPAQEPAARARNIQEVAIGYFEEQVKLESERCLQCKNAPCIKGCPVAINIPAFLQAAADGDYQKSVNIIKESSMLPAICGRVCPQETQCMAECTLGKSLKNMDKSVAIGRVERFVADWEREKGKMSIPEIAPPTGKKVGIVGSGPAGLTAAADVRKAGHEVVLFEAFHKLGGVMIYGIPEFRLPKEILDKEIENLLSMGVQIKKNFLVGRTRKIKDLIEQDGFDAIFVGTGAGLPNFMNIDGENLNGVSSANEFLTRANLMKAYSPDKADTPIFTGKRTAVVGGGNVAMDAARMALRVGAEEVYVIYRRTEAEMPARKEEVAHAKEEGIIFNFLSSPVKIIGDENGQVKAIECIRYELGEPDASGRRKPVAVKGSEFTLEMDSVIMALGNSSNPLISQTTLDIEVNKWGNIVTDENGKTSMDRVYAGGDIVLGAATVILAMGEGRRAAESINKLLAE